MERGEVVGIHTRYPTGIAGVDFGGGVLDVAPRSYLTTAGWLALGEEVAGDAPLHELRRLLRPTVVSEAQDWRWLLCREGRPWSCSWALSTVECESGGDPAALGHEWYDSDGDGIEEEWWFHSLWQIASRSRNPGLLADPEYNTARAESKFRSGGAAHWPNCGLAR